MMKAEGFLWGALGVAGALVFDKFLNGGKVTEKVAQSVGGGGIVEKITDTIQGGTEFVRETFTETKEVVVGAGETIKEGFDSVKNGSALFSGAISGGGDFLDWIKGVQQKTTEKLNTKSDSWSWGGKLGNTLMNIPLSMVEKSSNYFENNLWKPTFQLLENKKAKIAQTQTNQTTESKSRKKKSSTRYVSNTKNAKKLLGNKSIKEIVIVDKKSNVKGAYNTTRMQSLTSKGVKEEKIRKRLFG